MYFPLNWWCECVIINVMNDNTKIEVAREIMNFLIGQYGTNGYDKTNETLTMLMNDEQEMQKFNSEVINKIINVYGQLVKNNEVHKLKKLAVNTRTGCKVAPSCRECSESDLCTEMAR